MAKKNKTILIIVVVVVALVALGVLLWFLFGRGGGNGADRQKMKDALISQGDGSAKDSKLASCFVDKLSDSIGTSNAKKIILGADGDALAKYADEFATAGIKCGFEEAGTGLKNALKAIKRGF